eukprot:TRINITY_DN312_c0_g1_i1.p1 TRINITY_DN312_c0_g1~~TRINITY_DN312_c0_g1_i1.p1  ORF type:complete len:881 (+),score=144.51 TRINITY_DN312_c0_g1_i1:380-3022(+)
METRRRRKMPSPRDESFLNSVPHPHLPPRQRGIEGPGPDSEAPLLLLGLTVKQMESEVLEHSWLLKQSRYGFGHHWSKRYFVLQKNALLYYRSPPMEPQAPSKRIMLGPKCRVEDTGRVMQKDSLNAKEIYTFTVDSGKPLMIGTRSPEFAAAWMEKIRGIVERARGASQSTEGGMDSTLQRQLPDYDSASSSGTAAHTPGRASVNHENYHDDIMRFRMAHQAGGVANPAMPSPGVSVSHVAYDDDAMGHLSSMPSSETAGDGDMDNDTASDVDTDIELDMPDELHLHSPGQYGPPRNLGDKPTEAMEMLRAIQGMAAGDSNWQLVAIDNGLRYFQEMHEGKRGAMSSMGMVEARCEDVYRLLMHLGHARTEWDLAFAGAKIVFEEDGHADCIHYRMKHLPLGVLGWGLADRDLLLTRYWQRSSDGSYMILYQSTQSEKQPPDPSGKVVRASLTTGAFIVSPLSSNRCVVMHTVELDMRGWVPTCGPLANVLPVQHLLLSRVAGIREFFAQTKSGTVTALLEQPHARTMAMHMSDHSHRTAGPQLDEEELLMDDPPKGTGEREADAGAGMEPLQGREDHDTSMAARVSSRQAHFATACPRVSIGLSAEGQVQAALQWQKQWAWAADYGSLKPGAMKGGQNCWSEGDFAQFAVRSKSYLMDKLKEAARGTDMKLVAVDWLKSGERIDHIVARRKTVVEGARERNWTSEGDGEAGETNSSKKPFFFIVNLQIPAAEHYSMIFYWATQDPLAPGSLLSRFSSENDDLFRNARFKLIPRIVQGAWVVKRSVGSTPLIVAGALKVAYHRAADYVECDVDIGSSTVANGIVRFVLGYVQTLVVDMAFLIQANTDRELPERLLGSVRVSLLDPGAALDLDQEKVKVS